MDAIRTNWKTKILAAMLALALVVSFPSSVSFAEEPESNSSSVEQTENDPTTQGNDDTLDSSEPAVEDDQSSQPAAETTDPEASQNQSKSGAPMLKAPAATKSLQQMIDDAPDGGTVIITEDMEIDSTVSIPEGKTITLKDDGKAHKITSSNGSPLFDVLGTLIIDATSDENLTFQGVSEGLARKGSVATVTGTCLLKSGTVKGSCAQGVCEGTVVVLGGILDMSGGIITGMTNNGNGYVSTSTVVIYDNDGTPSEFNLSGGSISGNSPISGNTVLVSGSTMNMSGGAIESNSARGIMAIARSIINISGGLISNNEGSGVRMNSSTQLNLSGGTISNNTTQGSGGGIHMRDNTVLNMTGGTVTGNSAGSAGGGIYLSNTNGLNIQAGTITNNVAGGLGGGIYVNSSVAEARIDNVLVAENTATYMGGGVWCCPTSQADVSVTNGMAIFDNKVTGENAAGDDFANLDISENEGARVSVSERMLGGGLNVFYNDGGIVYVEEGNTFWSHWVVDDQEERYNPEEPGDTVKVDGMRVSRALKSSPSESAKEAAYSEAKVIITGNKAYAGGGIATNGSFTSGYSDRTWSMEVSKIWDAEVDPAMKTSVPVYLVVNGSVLDYVVLSEENNWSASFSDLPDPDTITSFELREGSFNEDGSATEQEPSKLWKIVYSIVSKDSDSKTIKATVTNSNLPEEPEEPEEPDTPPVDDSDRPKEPENQNDEPKKPEKESKNSVKEQSVVPETGDSQRAIMAFASIAMIASGAALLARRLKSNAEL